MAVIRRKSIFLAGAATQSLHGALLKHTQQFALQAVVQCRDFVEEQRAAVCELNEAWFGRVCAGKRALLVAEQL